MTKFLKKIAPFLILVSFLILSALLPEILGEDAKTLGKNYLGDNYKYILIAFFLLLFLFAAYISPDLSMGLFSKTDINNPDHYNIPPTDENHELLRKAKAAIAASHPDQALELLSTLKLKILDIEITALSARFADLERAYIRGTVSNGDKTTEQNKINESLILLITALEKEIAQSFEFYDKIRAALKSRYEIRLSQKLSNRQPVNLRIVPSTFGTNPQAANTFVQYSEGQIRGKLAEYYKDAEGRLLLLGAPGAGKTTLLLQLELELLEKETTRIPVILNLARWNNTFPTLEGWIQEILPSEMGLTINKKMAGDLIIQNRLILLLDGLDEVKAEDRLTFLEAIGAYGEDANRYFILSSRIYEYKAVAKDAPVNSQVEVGTLKYEQLVEQLEKTEQNEGSKRLLAALKEDEVLREIAEIPFYFNTLQLLFARGKYLHEFNFSAIDTDGRKKEIERNFVFEMFRKINAKGYDAQSSTKYLGFFASKLRSENLVDFELTHLQYTPVKLARWEAKIGIFLEAVAGGLFGSMTIGLVIGLIGALGVSLAAGFAAGLVAGLVAGLIIGLIQGLRVGSKVGLVGNLGVGLIVGLAVGLVDGLNGGLNVALVVGLGLCLGAGLGGGLIGGLVSGLVGGLAMLVSSGLMRVKMGGVPIISTSENIKWNWTTFISRKTLIGILVGGLVLGLVGILVKGLVGGLVGGLGGGLALGLAEGITKQRENHNSFIQISDPYQRFRASAMVLYFSILQHWHLCHLLRKKGLLPKKLVPFLNDMVSCNILETTGASWRFRHRILQDYFADQWVKTEFEPDKQKNIPTDQANSPEAL